MKDRSRFACGMLLATVSGAAALAHELVWTRRLVDLLGASADSTARVFGCFFLGLSLGAAVATRFARRARRPWRSVALAELGVAALAVPALLLPHWTDWIWPALGPELLAGPAGGGVKLVVSILVVVPPAVVMGMVLPLAGRAVLRGENRLSRQGVWLYAANTAGGVLGLLITSSLLLAWLGVGGSLQAAIAANVLAACAALLLDRRDTPRTDTQKLPPSRTASAQAAKEPEVPLAAWPAVLVCAFASGMGVLAIEMLAVHLLDRVMFRTLHSTTAVLASVLLLLAASAWLVPPLVRRGSVARTWLPLAASLAGLTAAMSPLLFMWYSGRLEPMEPGTNMVAAVLGISAYVLAAFAPCLLLAGMVFPLVFAWAGSEGGDPYGRRWGWLLAANGVGGAVGAELAQRVLMPQLGVYLGLGAVGLGYAALALFVHAVLSRPAGLRSWTIVPVSSAAAILALMIGILGGLPVTDPQPGDEIVAEYSGREGLVLVADRADYGRTVMFPNGYRLGSAAAARRQRRQAHLPLLLHPRPRRVAFIAMGTGITPSGALAHDAVESVSVVELSELVVRAATEKMGRYNGYLASDPRVEIVVEDGRTYLAACREEFDVVVGDYFVPFRAGVGRLHSLEHYRAVKRALRSGGMFCQWLPMWDLTAPQAEVILATFREAFPNTHLFRGALEVVAPSLALVGFKDDDARIDWEELEARCLRLRESGRADDPAVMDRAGIAALWMGPLGGENAVPPAVNTLDDAWLELNAGRDYLLGAWHAQRVKRERWLDFVDRHYREKAFPADADEGIKEVARVGYLIELWQMARHEGDASRAVELFSEVHRTIPDRLKFGERRLILSDALNWHLGLDRGAEPQGVP